MGTVIWSKDNCPFCIKAKEMLSLKDIKYEERNISSGNWSREQLLEAVPNAKTVPQIWLHGRYVGGYTELQQYYEDHDIWVN